MVPYFEYRLKMLNALSFKLYDIILTDRSAWESVQLLPESLRDSFLALLRESATDTLFNRDLVRGL